MTTNIFIPSMDKMKVSTMRKKKTIGNISACVIAVLLLISPLLLLNISPYETATNDTSELPKRAYILAGAAYVWDAPADGVASLDTNWDPVGVPGAGDSLIFDATSVFNCTIDITAALSVISMQTGFTGRVIQGANIAAGKFWIGAGTWAGSSSYTLTITISLTRNESTGVTPPGTKLIMAGAGATITGCMWINSLTISESASLLWGGALDGTVAEINIEGGSISILSGKTLTLALNTSLRVQTYHPLFDWTNSGSVGGEGVISFLFANLDLYRIRTITFGEIDCYTTIRHLGGGIGPRICYFGGTASFTKPVYAYASTSVQPMILDGGNSPVNLYFDDGLSMGQWSAFKAGNATIRASALTATHDTAAIYLENATVTITDSINLWGVDNFYANASSVIIETDPDLQPTNRFPIFIPTYDGQNESVHPSLVHFPDGWYGWDYWMIMTPFPTGDDDYENPSIIVSNDGYNWSVPYGLTNPISFIPTPPDWNKDPELIYVAETDELWAWWGYYNGSEHTYLSKSSNGITWSTPTLTTGSTLGMAKLKMEDTYLSWTIAEDKTVYRYSSTNGLAWEAAGTGAIIGTIPEGKVPWHYDVLWNEVTSQYWMMLHVRTSGGGFENLTFAYSTDGLSWYLQDGYVMFTPSSSWDDGGIYMSTSLIEPDGFLRVWYSGQTYRTPYSWQMGYTVLEYTHVGSVPIIATDNGFSLFQRGTISPYTQPTQQAITYTNLAISSGSKAFIACDLRVTSRLIVDGLLYGPDANMEVVSSNAVPVTLNGTFYGVIVVDGEPTSFTAYGTDSMQGYIKFRTTGHYVTPLNRLTITPSGWLSLQTVEMEGNHASWIIKTDGAATYTLRGLSYSVGYKVYLDGEEVSRHRTGGLVSFYVDGGGLFEVEVWDPYGNFGNYASMMMAMGLVIGIGAIFYSMVNSRRR